MSEKRPASDEATDGESQVAKRSKLDEEREVLAGLIVQLKQQVQSDKPISNELPMMVTSLQDLSSSAHSRMTLLSMISTVKKIILHEHTTPEADAKAQAVIEQLKKVVTSMTISPSSGRTQAAEEAVVPEPSTTTMEMSDVPAPTTETMPAQQTPALESASVASAPLHVTQGQGSEVANSAPALATPSQEQAIVSSPQEIDAAPTSSMAQIVAEDIIERNNEDNGHDQPVQTSASTATPLAALIGLPEQQPPQGTAVVAETQAQHTSTISSLNEEDDDDDVYYTLSKTQRKELKRYLKICKASNKYESRILKNEPNMIRNQDAPMTDHYVNTYLNWITLDACETRRRSNKGGALYLLSHWFQAYILTSTSQNKQYATRLCKKIANESIPRHKPDQPPFDITTFDLVVIPIHTGPYDDGHWAMALLQPDSGLLRVYDSQDSGLKRNWAPVVKAVNAWRSEMLQKANVVRGPIKLEVLRGPQQNDDHNCGVYALLWAHKWVYQLAHPDEFSEGEAQEFRKELADCLKDFTDPEKEKEEKKKDKEKAALRKLGIRIAEPVYNDASDTSDEGEIQSDEELFITHRKKKITAPAAASAGPSKRGGKDMETLKKHNAEHFKRMNEKVAAKGAKKAPKKSKRPKSPLRPRGWTAAQMGLSAAQMFVPSHKIVEPGPGISPTTSTCKRCQVIGPVHKCRCSPGVLRCLACYQFHASVEAHLKRRENEDFDDEDSEDLSEEFDVLGGDE